MCLYMVFPRQSSNGTCQNLEGCVSVAFPRKLPKKFIDVASGTAFACSDIAGPDLGTTSFEGYVQGNVPMLLGSLKQAAWPVQISLPSFCLFHQQRSQALFCATFFPLPCFLDAEFPKLLQICRISPS